jgi:hypothetical protein
MAAQMNAMFVITSAVESRFGVYSPEQRLDMTLATIANVREHVPGAKIVISEVSGNGLSQQYEDALIEQVDVYLDFTTNSDVRKIYNNPHWYDNWDIVKNLTELSTFPFALEQLILNQELEGIDRVFKMSGRYLLNDKFDIDFYNQESVVNKIVIGKEVPSQFPFHVTGQSMQYMCRVLSWPTWMQEDMIRYYLNGCNYMKDRMLAGGYADIEHCLYYAMPKERVFQVEEVGVYGNIAPNGVPIVN